MKQWMTLWDERGLSYDLHGSAVTPLYSSFSLGSRKKKNGYGKR